MRLLLRPGKVLRGSRLESVRACRVRRSLREDLAVGRVASRDVVREVGIRVVVKGLASFPWRREGEIEQVGVLQSINRASQHVSPR